MKMKAAFVGHLVFCKHSNEEGLRAAVAMLGVSTKYLSFSMTDRCESVGCDA